MWDTTGLITVNCPPKKKIQDLTTRTYLKEQELEVHTRVFLMPLNRLSNCMGKINLNLKTLNSAVLRQCCKELANIYNKDVNEAELEMECVHLKEYLEHVYSENEETDSILRIYHLLKGYKIEDTFPNVEIALRIFLSMIVTN
ncbi:Hypothetical protein CINCED_3A025651 [Cinara cedri]|uniref:Uncharacterized protein n=1 Tax=Cinara cedri TaxID=506608 RepID=A0A5E4M339_9HEMI|nr:Hypothetical protein CINCED_3A025651 [Cinara cedri]